MHDEIDGPVFFTSIKAFVEKFDILNNPDKVIIDFRTSAVEGMLATEVLNNLTDRY